MNKLFKNTSLYVIGNILPKIFMFLLLPVYTKYLLPKEYGIVVSLQVLAVFISLLFTFSLDRTIYRLYYDYENEDKKKIFLGTVAISIFVLSTFFLILLFLLRNQISKIYPSIPFYPFYAFVILDTYFVTFGKIPKTYFQVKQKALKFIIFSIMEFVFSVSAILVFIVYFKEGAVGLLKGKMLSSLVLAPIYLIITFRIVKLKFDATIFKSAILFALPGIPIMLSGWLMEQSDRIFIANYFTLTDVGIYTLAYKIAGISSMFIAAINTAYMPYYFQTANSKNQTNAKNKFYKYNMIIIFIIIITNFLIALFAKELIYFFIDIKYKSAEHIIPLISISYIISLSSSLFNLSIYQKKKNVSMMYISLFGALLNLILNFILIPKFAVYGAAFATILSAIFIFTATYNYSKKCYFVPINWHFIGTTFGLAITVIIIFCYVLNVGFYLQFAFKLVLCLFILLFFLKKYFNDIVQMLLSNKKE